MRRIARRDVLRQSLALAGLTATARAAAAAQEVPAPQPAVSPARGTTLRFFPGFTAETVKTSGADIYVLEGGAGPD